MYVHKQCEIWRGDNFFFLVDCATSLHEKNEKLWSKSKAFRASSVRKIKPQRFLGVHRCIGQTFSPVKGTQLDKNSAKKTKHGLPRPG